MAKQMVVLFGGQSPEHEVSITSFGGVFPSIPKDWQVYPLYIAKNGTWYVQERGEDVLAGKITQSDPCALIKDATRPDKVVLFHLSKMKPVTDVDFVFIVLHGENGEDGRLQGMLDMLGIPYSGSGAEASAVCMNKAITKHLCRLSDIPIVPWVAVDQSKRVSLDIEKISIKPPWIVKPARTGSSVGVSRVERKTDLDQALDLAFTHDSLALIEECIKGREIECGVLEDPKTGDIIASVPSEVIPGDIFYSYNDKYLNNKAKLICPATLDPMLTRRVQNLAVEGFKAVGGRGFARVDFFLRRNIEIFLSEINTIPGFTPISMYPRMFEASGMSREQLVSNIINAALRRHTQV